MTFQDFWLKFPHISEAVQDIFYFVFKGNFHGNFTLVDSLAASATIIFFASTRTIYIFLPSNTTTFWVSQGNQETFRQ